MSSPVKIPYSSFISIDKNAEEHLYIQIAQQLIYAIQREYLPVGCKLPGTRNLAILLNVHRKTIIAAYEETEAQGWTLTLANKGTFVIERILKTKERISKPNGSKQTNYPQQAGYAFTQSTILDNPFEHTNCPLYLNDGTPDIRLTQIDQLSRFYSANLKRKSNRKRLGYFNQEGSEYFKHQLSYYLNLSRGLHVSHENLMITRSTEMSIYITCEVLLSPNDIVVVASLSYFAVNMIFQKFGVQMRTIPVDEHGIIPEYLENLCIKEKIRMIYITPHHHYPTTVTLSRERREKLLELSSQYGFVILEDDYDYDFHYDSKTVLPIATSDTQGMVIYTGTFGKSMAPGFRTGFVVAPNDIMKEMRKHLGIIDRQGDILMEQALGEMIEEGEVNRQLKKSVKIYESRRDLFSTILQNRLGEHVEFDIPNGGLAFWLRWKKTTNLLKLSSNCSKEGLFIPKNILYQNQSLTAIRFGFGHLNEQEMHQSLDIISKVLE